jgi:hypothetical protein
MVGATDALLAFHCRSRTPQEILRPEGEFRFDRLARRLIDDALGAFQTRPVLLLQTRTDSSIRGL